jgi:NAD(P)-dependent dehydrogenase (short-subunit alcohol dehydrogenase family)
MNFNFKNKNVLITGTSQGIGYQLAKDFIDDGARVIGVSRKKTIIKGDYYHIVEDLFKLNSVKNIITKLKNKKLWPIDILVHNAGGTLDITDPFCSQKDWKKVFRINFEVIVELDSFISKSMIKRKKGRIVYVSSISAMENHGPVTYCSAKAALAAYTRSFGGILAPHGIVASCVLPGAVIAPNNYWDKKIKSDPKHVKKYLTERQRIGRFGNTKEISNFIKFLSSEYASFNTGSIIPIDGGQGRGYFGQ